jgi:hypothetical protein
MGAAMILRDATPTEMEAVLGQTAPLWSEGLPLASYFDWVRTLQDSAWGKAGNVRFLVLSNEESGEVVSGMKLYRLSARLERSPVSVGGIGAVFTLKQHRGHGHAGAMISAAHRIMVERGDAFSLLYSDIGATYYARLGYQEVDPRPVTLNVPETGSAPEGVTRMHRTDLDTLLRLRQMENERTPFAILRSADYFRYLLARWSFPTSHHEPERWESRIMLSGSDGYLWALFTRTGPEPGKARLMEFAEAVPGATLPALLDDLFAECRRRDVKQLDAWMPTGRAARDPRLADLVTPALSATAVPMWFPLDEESAAAMKRCASGILLDLGDAF